MESQKKLIDRLEKSEHDLKERVKELNCLYGISKIADDADSVDQLLEEVVTLIPPAMQYPELTTCQIKYAGKVYRTTIFKETAYKLSTAIDIAGKRLEVDIFYLQDLPFLEFEAFLVRDIGTRLKVSIETKEDMKKQVLDARVKAIMENYEQLEKKVRDRGTLSDIDLVDKQIISLLSQDGRMKLVDIGEKLSVEDKQGYSHVGVKNRITKLLDADAIRIQATLNLQKYKVVVGILLIETGSAVEARRIIEQFKSCPRVLFCLESVGKYNLIYGIIADSIDELQSFINTCSPKTEPGVKDVMILVSTRLVEPSFFPTRYFDSRGTACEKHKDGSCRSCPGNGVPVLVDKGQGQKPRAVEDD
ncbi:MAG: Lrp/AsnC family transcriptional regulator [Candidatus Lokiarchaeota archaeon]|nr:Lrp/AsnC family transcriptional regulator [Candidatus Lokiarchaeota archaeon]